MKKNNRLLNAGGLITVGILLMVYPFFSNFLYERRQEEIIHDYQNTLESEDVSSLEEEHRKAVDYNDRLRDSKVLLTDPFVPDDTDLPNTREYQELLNLYGDGIMGYVEIPSISVLLPIYHGTSAEVLEKGVGHLEETSLPVGGKGTHTVLSAHTGLSDRRLFTDLELLEEGDTFYIRVLEEILAYRVDDIRIVEPQDISSLYIAQERDYVTLVTCTPYGVNSHRLLVRGNRIPYTEEEKRAEEPVKEPSLWMRQYLTAVLTGMALLSFLFLCFWVHGRRRR